MALASSHFGLMDLYVLYCQNRASASSQYRTPFKDKQGPVIALTNGQVSSSSF